MKALDQWLAAESQLRQAASDFLYACTNLRAAAPQSFSSVPNQLALENFLGEVKSRIDAIELVESRMHESRAVLHGLLNSSTSRAPINRLPPETLCRIFSIVAATSSCTPSKGQRDSFRDIPLVCAKWHQIVSSTPSLRSHIDLHFGALSSTVDLLDRARRCLDLCRGIPIHIHLSNYPAKGKPDAVSKLVSTLEPHLRYLSSLRVRGANARFVQDLLALYSSQGTPGRLKSLALSNIRVLDRRNVISWSTSSPQGLVELELCDINQPTCPRLSELVAVLSHCPALHTLRLARLEILIDQFQSYWTISFPCLRVLDIASVYGGGLPPLLEMVSPGTLDLDLRLEDCDPRSWFPPDVIRPLLARSNVVALTMDDIQSSFPDHFISYLPSLQGLRALHLNLSKTSTADILRAGVISSTPDGDTSRLPNLRSLCLSNSLIADLIFEGVEHAVSTLRLKNLVFLALSTFLRLEAER